MSSYGSVHPLIFLCVCLVCSLTGCTEKSNKPVPLAPCHYLAESEMEAFVADVLSGKLTGREPHTPALKTYYVTLDRDDQQSLQHELNFMLKVRGSKQRFYFQENGQIVEAPPNPANRNILNDFVKELRLRRSPDTLTMGKHLIYVQMHNGEAALERDLAELNSRLAGLGKRIEWDGRQVTVVAK